MVMHEGEASLADRYICTQYFVFARIAPVALRLVRPSSPFKTCYKLTSPSSLSLLISLRPTEYVCKLLRWSADMMVDKADAARSLASTFYSDLYPYEEGVLGAVGHSSVHRRSVAPVDSYGSAVRCHP